MNPLKYAQMIKYLTRAKKEKPDLPDVFSASKAPIPAKTQNVQEIEAINRFIKANPRTEKAGGGMLVQPSADGSRPGYAKDLPEGISIRPHGKYPDQKYYTYQITKDGKTVSSNMLKATPKNLKRIVDMRNEAMNKVYPGRTSKTEFTKLRKKYSKLKTNEFAKKLTDLGNKTFQGKDFTEENVRNLMTKYNIKSEVASNLKRPISEIKKIIRESSGGNEFIKKFGNDENMLRKKAYTVSGMKNRKNIKFASDTSNEAKQWFSLFRASNGGDRIKMIGTFNGQDISNIDNWPRDKNEKIDWSIKGTNGEPAWKNVKFVDTKAPVKNAVFEWNTEKKPNGQYKYVSGNLKNQIDNVFGEGFFRKSTAAYDLQAMSGTKNIMYKGKSLPPKQVIATKMIENEYKNKYGKMPSKDYVSRRLNFVSFQEAHHPYGVANDPYFTELASKAANSRLTLIEEKYKKLIEKTPANKNKLINDFKKEVRDLSSEFGNIRTGQVIDTGGLFGTKAKARELYQSGLTQANVKTGSPLYKKLMTFCPTKNGGQAGTCSIDEAMDGLISESKQLQSGNMNKAQAEKTARKIRAVTRVGTGSTLTSLLGPYGLAGEVVIDGAFMANNMLDGGDTYKEALSKSLIKYAMPTDARKQLEKETDRDRMIIGSDTQGLAADFVSAKQKYDDLINKYENVQKIKKDETYDIDTLDPTYTFKDEQKAQKDFERAQIKAQPMYGKNIFDIIKYDSPEQQAFAAKEEVFDAQKMQNRMDYDRKILGPIKDLFGTGFYSPAQQKLLELKADRETLDPFGRVQMSDEDKMQEIANYGGVANLAGGGIAKLAGVSSGVAPESGPNPQGLLSLKNRVRNY
jgi:hypothetical protein